MLITKNDLKQCVKELKELEYHNKVDKYRALFFPIEVEDLHDNTNDFVLLTEVKERVVGFSNSAKPGLVYLDDEVYLGYVIKDNQQAISLPAYYRLLSELNDTNYPETILLTKDAYITNVEHIVSLTPIN